MVQLCVHINRVSVAPVYAARAAVGSGKTANIPRRLGKTVVVPVGIAYCVIDSAGSPDVICATAVKAAPVVPV